MPTYGRDHDASNEEQRRIRWEDKIGFHLEPEEFMEVVDFPHGGLKNESGGRLGEVISKQSVKGVAWFLLEAYCKL